MLQAQISGTVTDSLTCEPVPYIAVYYDGKGVGSITDTSGGSVVAVVNGDGISAGAFQRAYQQQVEAIQRSNPGITREELAKQNIGGRVLNVLILQKLLEQEAERLGISVSALEMRQAVGTSAAISWPIAISGTVGFIIVGWGDPQLPAWSLGYVSLPATLGIACSSVFFAPLGAKLAHSLPVPVLRRFFAVFLYVTAGEMLWNILH